MLCCSCAAARLPFPPLCLVSCVVPGLAFCCLCSISHLISFTLFFSLKLFIALPPPHLAALRALYLCSKSFMKAVDLLVELASLQTAFLTLDEAIKTTNRRVNALEHVVKPRLENTIAYIKVCWRG